MGDMTDSERTREILRKVRQGRTVTVSYHGEPVAEIRPIGGKGAELERRIRMFEGLGILVAADEPGGRFEPIAKRPGALARFLTERDE